MRKVILGGFFFVGGAIMYSVGVLQIPEAIGIVSILVGVVLGVLGMIKDKNEEEK